MELENQLQKLKQLDSSSLRSSNITQYVDNAATVNFFFFVSILI